MFNENHDTSTAPKDRHLVAVPDPQASTTATNDLYRLGVQVDRPGDTFTPGENGPAHQRLPWIYMRSGDNIRFAIDLDKGTLSIVITDPKSGNSGFVVHQIDVEALKKQQIEIGKPLKIVFLYNERFVDETPTIDEVCGTTGPRYTEELRERLHQINNLVVEVEQAENEAKEHGHYTVSDHAPKSAKTLTPEKAFKPGGVQTYAPSADADGENLEVDMTLPEGVQIYDPISGKTFVGRRWARPHEHTTLEALVNGGYRLAVVEFRNGDTATLMPHYSGKKMAIQIKTAKGLVSRVLDESANQATLGPGERINVPMSHTLDGDHAVQGQMLTTPAVVVVVGVGPEADRADLPYPKDHTLEKFRAQEGPRHDNGPELGHKFAKAG